MSLRGASPSNLYGLVDMGSNGIRFSITDLSPATARSLPTVYQDREGISLYDAQYSTGVKGPIPQETVNAVLTSLSKFQITCADFGVPATNIRVLATEATRTAENSEDYRRQIKQVTGWDVDLLPKEVEGRIGALGVASSFASVDGLVMDLGGGSTQITWMIAKDGRVDTSHKGSFSFPYGAAAMSRHLAEIEAQDHPKSARSDLKTTMKQQFQQAYRELELPKSLQQKAEHGGLTLYLSGGGFRGWGYLLMSQHKVSPYPIPIINGFHVQKREFQQTAEISAVAAEESIFRISKRRAAQVPAVAFLVNVLVEALPMIQHVRFCQGGVREGFLFDTLDPATKALDPLQAATAKYGTESAEHIAELLFSGLPGANSLDRYIPETFTPPFVRSVADMMYLHCDLPKESRSLAALQAPLTGVLASAHGISHSDRALLALTLCRRWNVDLAPPNHTLQERLRSILSPQEVFWANYLGALASLVGDVYPAGRIVDPTRRPRLHFHAVWSAGLGKKGLMDGVRLTIKGRENDDMTSPAAINDAVEEIEAVGKKKNRVGGREHAFGVPIEITIERVLH
ncbi:retrograde regulation protein 2 [Exophiala aquamarina CBS 119918]|uniref:Retrograde regulation protein 2 n=1 Tax=Exophiala aquamarina CBS 119918 TaxID=1182545 RepID=A0A072P3V1_9EURO|nr:retrograde regulation protein 2 [Exophiala aquamarina CBS 119918]KEF54382.1 retrograde regulation protein 2 [Exophiala aquamarina CBS 119918]